MKKKMTSFSVVAWLKESLKHPITFIDEHFSVTDEEVLQVLKEDMEKRKEEHD